MHYQTALQDTTSEDYLIHRPPTGSSIQFGSEELNALFSVWIKQGRRAMPLWYQNLLPLLKTDISSVKPYFRIKNETFPTETAQITEEMIIAEMTKIDFVFRMPPLREYTVRVKIKNIGKATPHIVE